MILVDWLVRRTSLYRAAEAELVRSAEARTHAEDTLDRLKARVEELVADRDSARADATDAARRVADWLALRTFGMSVFDRSLTFDPTPPEVTESISRATPIHGRDHAREMTRKFLEDCKRYANAG